MFFHYLIGDAMKTIKISENLMPKLEEVNARLIFSNKKMSQSELVEKIVLKVLEDQILVENLIDYETKTSNKKVKSNII
jgi:hypothetical protein